MIPVDLVAAALCAVAAAEPPDEPEVVQVASGSVNPLRYRNLVDLVSGWFTEHPLYDSQGQPIVVPEWSFPGRGRVQAQLKRARQALDRAERLLQSLPLRGRQAELSARIEEKREQADRALGYVELYGAYAECEAVYCVDELLARWEALDEADQELFGFDPRVIRWPHYVRDVHLPSIVEQARVRTEPGTKAGPSREERLPASRCWPRAPPGRLRPREHAHRLERGGVLRLAGNPPATDRGPRPLRGPHAGRGPGAARTRPARPQRLPPPLLPPVRERRSTRSKRTPSSCSATLILTKSFPSAIRRVREHRRRGHRTVLITGALDFVVRPLAPLFDDVVCATMRAEDGRYTGELDDVPPTGEARAQAMADYAAAEGLDLAESVAYADSASDLPMLEAVGFPVAVNPETRLSALARRRGWLVEQFDPAPRRSSQAPAAGAPHGRCPVKALRFER